MSDNPAHTDVFDDETVDEDGAESDDGPGFDAILSEDGPASPREGDSDRQVTWNDAGVDGTVFEAENLVVGYPSVDEPVIDGEWIAAAPGSVTALVGPNGSGKSTLLKGLADQLTPRDGAVYLDGKRVQSLETKQLARRLGLLSQENVSPDGLTVEKLVEHGRYPHRGFFERLDDDDRAAIDCAIDLAGVDHLRDRTLGSLSGGQKQLVWIAMVLAQETDVLLLDEPTTFLDLNHQLQVMETVGRLRDESDRTVVVVLHDLQQAARHADYMVALEDGTVYARGRPEAVVTEELLADVFDVEAEVSVGEHGPQITPLRPLDGGGTDPDGSER